ncbi:MAG: hypothetical protein ACI8RD_002061 [Bacillariaceae sp.]|jgi:hypothetical protein
MIDEGIDEESLLHPLQQHHKHQNYRSNDDDSSIDVIGHLHQYNFNNTGGNNQQQRQQQRQQQQQNQTPSSYFHFGHPLQRIRKSLQQSTSRLSLLPLHHQKYEESDTMSGFSATSGGNGDRESESNTFFPDNIPSLSSPQPQQQQQQQQQQQSRRKKSLAGKVKASVARPARAVGRRVFRNRSSKTVEGTPLGQNINDDTNINTVFRNSQASSARSINSEGSNTNANNGGGLYGSLDNDPTDCGVGGVRGLMNAALTKSNHSLRRMISQRSMSITCGSGNENKEDNATATSAYNNDVNWPVRQVETITRTVGLLCGAYALGACHPEWSSVVSRMLEFIVTAWVTCMVILGLGWVRQFQLEQQQQDQEQIISPEQQYFQQTSLSHQQQQQQQQNQHQGEGRNLVASTLPVNQGSDKSELIPLLQQQQQQHDKTEPAINNNVVRDSLIGSKSQKGEAGQQEKIPEFVIESTSSFGSGDLSSQLKQQQQEVEHPNLTSFYIIDSYSGKRISCNDSTPFHISNEWFEMDMLVLIRTPDTDDTDAVRGTAANDRVSDYMRNKQRRFEFQYQVKLKKDPVGKQLYFSCELDDPIKMGIITKAFVSAAMAFVKKTNPTFHYNITGSKNKTSDGKYENPHMSFTVEGGLDRLVVTKPGETPPELGSVIHEDPESIKKRKSGILTNWNTEDTYTLALWSSYVDFLEWQCLNLPGIKPFGLASVLGTQCVNLTMYLIDEDRKEADNHYRRDLTEIIRLELSNDKKSGTGTEAKKWINAEILRQEQQEDDQQQKQKQENDLVPATVSPTILGGRKRLFSEESEVSTSNFSTKGGGVVFSDDLTLDRSGSIQNISKFNMSAEEVIDENEEVDDEDMANAAELGEGIYLQSGDSVIIREFLSIDEKSTACSVINGGGFAVLARRDLPIVIEKAKRSKKNKLIKSGDTVIFSMIQNKAGTDETETQYLSIHRGWWLKWVTTMPSKNGFFQIFTHETELGERALPTDETQSSFLTLGGSFTLRHKRWSRYSVGISAEPSTDFGGRMLSLYNLKHNKGASAEEERPQATYQSEDDDENDKEMPSIGDSGWIKPLVLCTQDPNTCSLTGMFSPRKSPPKPLRVDDNDQERVEPRTPSGSKLIFSNEHSHADVPAWIEMMDRVQRVRQLFYVVRVTHRNPVGGEPTSTNDETFIRLKSGKELAHIMNIGQSVEIPHVAPKTMTAVSSSTNVLDSNNAFSSNQSFSAEIAPGSTMSGEGDEGIFAKKTALDEYIIGGEGSFEDPGLYYENDNSIIEDDYTEESLSDSSLSETGTSKKGKFRRKVKRVAKKAVVGTGRITAKTAKGKYALSQI